MYNVGVLGCGKIAQVRHFPEYAANADVNIAGVYDLNEKRAASLATQYGAKAYTSYKELLKDVSIDAVSVCTANSAHEEMTIAALEAGKHVLCEKPMALSLEACEKMVQTAKKSGKYLMIGHNQRLLKTHRRAKQLIEEGSIGEVITFRTSFAHGGPESWSIDGGKGTWFFDKSRAVMGAMADLGIHKTDLIQYLTEQTVDSVTAFVGTLNKKNPDGSAIGVDDNAICVYQMSGGTVGTVTASWSCYGREDNSTVLYGTKGVMKIFCERDYSIVLEKDTGESVYYDIDQIQTNEKQDTSGVIDMFVESLKMGVSPELDGEEAIKSMKAIFAAMESAKTGKTVKVK